MLQATELLKFVFDRDPTAVQARLSDFRQEVASVFPETIKFHIYETEFYSKGDGSLDFGRTSSCFQVVDDDVIVDFAASERLLDATDKPELKRILEKFEVVAVEVSWASD